MKKIIKKFWGVALVVMMLSSLFIVATPAAAAPYAFTNAVALPTMTNAGFIAVAQSGDVIYATAVDGANADWLYKSSDAGATWVPIASNSAVVGAPTPKGLPALGTSVWGLIAVAPDDPNMVAVVDTDAAGGVINNVYLSNTGGTVFSAIGAGATFTATLVINSIDISPLDATPSHYVVIGGADGATPVLTTWQTGLLAPAWAVPAGFAMPAGTADVQAVKYSPSFVIDGALLFITEEVAAAPALDSIQLHLYSYGYTLVDPLGFSFPRAVAAGSAAAATITSLHAVIVLDDLFSLSDYEVGFIAAEITDSVTTQVGGVFRIDTGIGALTRLQGSATGGATGIAFNSAAWDGTNLMTAPYIAAQPAPPAAITIFRSSTALSAAPTFLGSSAYKTPGTGFLPIVFFAGGNGFCVSQGSSAAVAKSTDLGRSFDGVALFNNSLATVSDFWMKSDGSVIYAVTDEGAAGDLILWKKTGATWARVFILANGGNAAPAWLVRAAESDTNAVYLGRVGFKTIYKSTDGGQYVWTPRSCTQFIADFAVQSATVLYVASSTTGTVVKTSNGTTSWTTVGALTAGFGYSLTLIADNEFVVGGTTGYVGYYDGAAWTAIPSQLGGAGGTNTLATASGTGTDDVIMAGNSLGIGIWTIGTSTALTGWAGDFIAPFPAVDGLVYVNEILYAADDAANIVYRYITPTASVAAADDAITTGVIAVPAGAATINTLQATVGSNTLWVRVTATPDALYSYTEFIVGAAAIPTPTYPIAGDIIAVNSLNGNTNPFVFQWNSLLGTAFDIQIFQDATMNIQVAATAAPAGNAGVGGAYSLPNTAAVFGAGGFVGTAGQTYYWRIRIAATSPLRSFWTDLQTFTVQQLGAIVPEISSPPNGSNVVTLTPAFSWTPITGATMYEFQLAREPSFALMEYTDNVTSSGAALPVATRLTDGETYFWRVRAIAPSVGDWSQVGIFTVAIPVTPTPTPPITPTTTITILPTPTLTVTIPPQVTITFPTPTAKTEISPAYIWAIIIIGAVLVIAVIVLIVRTRRSV